MSILARCTSAMFHNRRGGFPHLNGVLKTERVQHQRRVSKVELGSAVVFKFGIGKISAHPATVSTPARFVAINIRVRSVPLKVSYIIGPM